MPDALEKYLTSEALQRLREAGDITHLIDELAEEELEQETVNHGRNVTGIANIMFISPKGRTRHEPRIKIAIDPSDSFAPHGEIATVTFDGEVVGGTVPPALLRQVRQFLELNRGVLLEYCGTMKFLLTNCSAVSAALMPSAPPGSPLSSPPQAHSELQLRRLEQSDRRRSSRRRAG